VKLALATALIPALLLPPMIVRAQSGAPARDRRSPLASPVAPRCEADLLRQSVFMRGSVNRGETYQIRTEPWILTLNPGREGWGWWLSVMDRGREGDDLSRLTPPLHGANPRHLDGWNFRNADNTGPNDGSVNVPGELREFIFSPAVGREIEYRGSGTTGDELATVRAFGRGWLFVDSYRLTPPRRGERASFESLTFRVCLTWPSSGTAVTSTSAADPVAAAVRRVTTFLPTLDVFDARRHERTLTAYYTPRGEYGDARYLQVIIESFDTDAAAAETWRERDAGTTLISATYRETLRGSRLLWWEGRRLLGRIGRHIVNVTAFRTDAEASVRLVYLNLRAELEGTRTPQMEQLDPRIGPADASTFADVRDARRWMNPFLSVCPQGVSVAVRAVDTDVRVPIADLRRTLLDLPVEAWPSGRVVAFSDCSLRGSGEEAAQAQRVRDVLEMLKMLGLRVEHWPS